MRIPALLLLMLSLSTLSAQQRIREPLGSAFIDERGALWLRDGDGWQSGGEGLPEKVVYPFEGGVTRELTALSVAGEELLVTTGRELFRGTPGSWREIAGRSQFGTWAYFTAVAGDRRDRIALGTSFHGLFYSEDGGESWTDLADRLPSLERGASYIEEIGSLALLDSELYLLADYGRSLYRLDLSDTQAPAEPLSLPGGVDRALGLRRSREGTLLLEAPAASSSQIAVYGLNGEEWEDLGSEAPPGRTAALGSEERRRVESAGGKRGVYLPIRSASGEALEEMIAFAEGNGINAFVIDFKDDWGRVTFDAEYPMVRETGALRGYLDLEELVSRLEEAGIYLIGRVVVFKDRELHGFEENRFALRDRVTGEPWGVEIPARIVDGRRLAASLREHWVDQYSAEVWEYNVAIAEELERRGVDEIQFDYIRFPSDGPTGRISWPHRREGMSEEDALESFLTLARERISVPIGIDIFGFNGYYEMDYLGQNMRLLARQVDVISPMWYPSHFAMDFLPGLDYLDRARAIYERGSQRARLITGDQVVIRPYVQAFLIGRELEMDEPTYRRYLLEQLEGSEAGGADGYLLWNFSGRYYMVE